MISKLCIIFDHAGLWTTDPFGKHILPVDGSSEDQRKIGLEKKSVGLV